MFSIFKCSVSNDDPSVKRGPGRPPGTGPKQIAARLAQSQGEPAPAKCPVGRPRKLPRIDKGSDASGVRVDMVKTVCLALHFMLNSKLTPVLDHFWFFSCFKVL